MPIPSGIGVSQIAGCGRVSAGGALATGVDPVSRAELWRLISQAAADGTPEVHFREAFGPGEPPMSQKMIRLWQ